MTVAGREEAAADDLRRRGFAVFYAWDRVRRNRRRGRNVITEWVRRAHFPGYVFVEALPVDLWRVLSASGVLRVVSFDGAPVAIPEPAMSAIMAGADPDGRMGARDEVARKRFEAAQRVRFKADGPLAGLLATVFEG